MQYSDKNNESQKHMVKINIFIVALILIFITPHRSFAGLGETRLQVRADATKLGLHQLKTGVGLGYSTVTLVLEKSSTGVSGRRKNLTVEEYIGTSGNVFAVAWKGSRLPDLSVLLGTRFERLAHIPHPISRQRLFYQDNRLAISVVGSARFRVGRAWIPGELPAGFNPSQIRVDTP